MPTIRLTGDGKVVLIDGKPSCVCCCTGAPEIQWDSRSASKTKCGYDAGIVVCGTLNNFYLTLSRSGFCAIDPPESDFFCNSTQRQFSSGGGYFTGPTSFDPNTCEESGSPEYTNCTEPGQGGVQLNEISDEYLTSDLISNTLAALPGFPGTWDGTDGSYYDLTPDELTNSIRESKYRFSFTIPGGSCYRINWVEDGTPKTWQYTGGGTPGDIGYSDEYTIPIPSSNRTATVTDITFSCETCI